MKKSIGIAAAVVAAALFVSVAALPASAKKKPKNQPVVLTAEQLATAVIAIGDMPTDWSTSGPSDPLLTTDPVGGACGGPGEPARAQTAGTVAALGSDFEAGGGNGPSFHSRIYAFPSNKGAKAFVVANRSLLTTCPQEPDVDNNGDPVSIVLQEVSFPKIGDERVALRFVATELDPDLQGISYSTDQIYIRSANYVLAEGQSVSGGLLSEPGDPKLNETYAKLGLLKLKVAVRNAERAVKSKSGKGS